MSFFASSDGASWSHRAGMEAIYLAELEIDEERSAMAVVSTGWGPREYRMPSETPQIFVVEFYGLW